MPPWGPGIHGSSGVPPSGVTNHRATQGSRDFVWRPPGCFHPGVQEPPRASPRVLPPWGPGIYLAPSPPPRPCEAIRVRTGAGRARRRRCCGARGPRSYSVTSCPGPSTGTGKAGRQARGHAGRQGRRRHARCLKCAAGLGVPASASCDALLSVPGGPAACLRTCLPARALTGGRGSLHRCRSRRDGHHLTK